ncbi:MAG: glucosamine-6-phosphate deaminase [Candidatus Aminicenantes bacterium]|nr:glucosamine-6-phosphate deaminase [Candidatus Aminicenantes bacterium]
MEVIIQPDITSASRLAAKFALNVLNKKKDAVLGLASGQSPLFFYKELIRLNKENKIDFSHVITFNLDEYVGLPGDHPCSYRYSMQENLFNHINIKPENIHIPNGTAEDIPAECRSYEQAIEKKGGIDLQILGVGVDGHIGFNEPSSSLGSPTRIKTLTDQTRWDNARFFDNLDEVPRHCITMGVGTIMKSRKVFLFAFGANKADVIAKTIEGPITAMVPATILQTHPKVKIFIDEAAAEKLKRKNYYEWVFNNKPSWQKYD